MSYLSIYITKFRVITERDTPGFSRGEPSFPSQKPIYMECCYMTPQRFGFGYTNCQSR